MKSVYFITKDSVVIEVWNEEFNPEILYVNFEFKFQDNVIFGFSVQDVVNLLVLLERGEKGSTKDLEGANIILINKNMILVQANANSRMYFSVDISGLSLTDTLKKWLEYRS